MTPPLALRNRDLRCAPQAHADGPAQASGARSEPQASGGEHGPPNPRNVLEPGFTLIEMIAVVGIFALLVALIAPNLGRLSGRTLREAADDLAARLELARQRTVVTGIQHRVWIDLDAATYRLEWLASETEEPAPAEPVEPAELELRGETPLPLEAPRDATRAFRPLPGSLGRDEVLAESLAFRGVETPGGFSDRGEVAIEFAPDGSADSTTLFLDDESGNGLLIDVLPLADAVRVSDAEG
jgi:prepilin-type N-terminal cleavage/methylation domain-containing protein